jgi:hypothetical protein
MIINIVTLQREADMPRGRTTGRPGADEKAQVDILTNALTTLRRQNVKSVKRCRTMTSPQYLSETNDISWFSEPPSYSVKSVKSVNNGAMVENSTDMILPRW